MFFKFLIGKKIVFFLLLKGVRILFGNKNNSISVQRVVGSGSDAVCCGCP